MRVDIERAGVRYYCTTEEQLQLFLSKGYKVIEQPKQTTRAKAEAKTKTSIKK